MPSGGAHGQLPVALPSQGRLQFVNWDGKLEGESTPLHFRRFFRQTAALENARQFQLPMEELGDCERVGDAPGETDTPPPREKHERESGGTRKRLPYRTIAPVRAIRSCQLPPLVPIGDTFTSVRLQSPSWLVQSVGSSPAIQ